jgi:DNA uptake protein ComE-like DNA-binding protein
MLEFLPGMTPALAAAIVDWRDADSELTMNGAEDETYQRLNPSLPLQERRLRFAR